MSLQRHRLTLSLLVKGVAGQAPTEPFSASFGEAGGSIGRREDNDWVLPDAQRFISGRHALISFSDGGFFVTDVSSNGVYLNRSEAPLGNGGSAPLHQGDILTIGEYEIEVSLRESAEPAAGTSGFEALDDPYARLRDQHAGLELESPFAALDAQPEAGPAEPPFTLEALTPLAPESASASTLEGAQTVASESDHVSDLDACFSQPGLIPEDWQEDAGVGRAATEAETTGNGEEVSLPSFPAAVSGGRVDRPAAPGRGASGASGDGASAPVADAQPLRQALADGLGISRQLLDDLPLQLLLGNLGQIVRSSVEGSMSVLRARAQMKSEFRMSQTMIRPVENNPLKFSVNPEEALRHLVDPRPNSGYLPPLAAFQEAHEDIEAHLLAVMVGMQSALKAVLLRFKPENLEQRLRQTALLERIPLYRQAKSWELFTALYSEIANEAEDDFQQLFGRAFSQAYEAQIRRLDSLRYADSGVPIQHRN